MLPSIATGQFGIATKPIYGSNSVHGIKIVSKTDAKDDEGSRNCPSLPLLSEGSFTSLVSRRSEKSLENSQERGNRGAEEHLSRDDVNSRSTGLKTKQLQLNCELKDVDRGWYPQGLNPRLANSSRPSQLPTMGLHMMSTSQRLLLQQSLGQPVESLHSRRKQTTANKKGYLMTLGGQTQISSRYRMPAVASGPVSPTKEVSAAISSHAPEHILPRTHKGGASKPEGVAIHSRCCCRHHKQDNEPRTALKSRSSESLRKERVYKERKEASNNEKQVKPTDRPPPKKQPKFSGYLQSNRKSKRANVLASDSNTSLQEQRKRVKKSVPKMPEQKFLKSPKRVEDTASAAPAPMAESPTKENPDEVMIYIESFSEIPHAEDEKEVMDKMDVDDIAESELKEQSNRVDVISVASLQTVAACDPQRSATPRLLKVSSEQQADISSLSQVFKKLDTDCDGHVSFNELKKSLPSFLTRHQINYLKKIYDMACESTYFGLEEFAATHQMCDLLGKSSRMVSSTFSTLDWSLMDSWLGTFMEAFSKEDKTQSGIIDMQSFQSMLASVINVHSNSFIIEKILQNLGKSKDDTISGVELLAYIPYFVAVAPKDT